MRRIQRATLELSGSPQFALISGVLAALRHKIDPDCLTACTNGVDVIWGTELLARLTPRQIAYVLAHEAAHSFFMHNQTAQRLHQINPEIAGIAVDQVVNNFLTDCDPDESVIQHPGEHSYEVNGMPVRVPVILDRKYQGMSVFDVFKDLLENTPEDKSQFDLHDFMQSLPPEDQKELEAAIEAGKRAADRLQSMNRDVDIGVTDKVDWRIHLSRWLYAQGKGKQETSWKRPNRRMAAQGVYLPSALHQQAIRRAVFAIDTSGSIQGEELAESVSTIIEIVRQLGGEEIHVLYWDDGVARHETYTAATGQKLSKTTPAGGGGTNFAPVLRYIDKHKLEPDLMIVTTDGYISDFGKAPNYPALWVVSTPETPPWGTVLRT